jgi:ribonuclease P protein component
MAAQRPELRLPRSARLKHRRDFAEVRRDGRRLVHGCLIANWRLLSAGSRSRLGVVTGRRLGSAVVRSRARRLLRETFRLHQIHFRQPVALVLVARSSIVGMSFAEVERDFLAALRRASLLGSTS